MEDASGTDRGRCGESGFSESSVPVGGWSWKGESGRNELLRGPFALFGVRISAKLVRDLAEWLRQGPSPALNA